MSEIKENTDMTPWSDRLLVIFRKAESDWKTPQKDGKTRLTQSNDIVSEYFRLLSDFYSGTKPERSKNMKLYSDFALSQTKNLTVKENRENWKELLHAVNSDPKLQSEYGRMRQNLSTASLYHQAQIEDCPIPLDIK